MKMRIIRDSAERMRGFFLCYPLHGVEFVGGWFVFPLRASCVGYVSGWVYRASAFAKAWHRWDSGEVTHRFHFLANIVRKS